MSLFVSAVSNLSGWVRSAPGYVVSCATSKTAQHVAFGALVGVGTFVSNVVARSVVRAKTLNPKILWQVIKLPQPSYPGIVKLLAIITPPLEELVFRKGFDSYLRRRIAPSTLIGEISSAFASSALFAMVHVPGRDRNEQRYVFSSTFVMGSIYSAFTRYTGGITSAVTAHTVHNLLTAAWASAQSKPLDPITLINPTIRSIYVKLWAARCHAALQQYPMFSLERKREEIRAFPTALERARQFTLPPGVGKLITNELMQELGLAGS